MNFSILIPHYKSKITAYTIAQLLKYKGKHDIQIIVIDNSPNDESFDYLYPFAGDFIYEQYPTNILQSHGIAFDHALKEGLVANEYFITIESDAFPTNDTWLDYYEDLINKGYDTGGSLLSLSGGCYLHPCGTFYRKSVWQEAKDYCDKIEYAYFPNMAKKEGFDCHLMVHKSVLEKFINAPEDYVDLAQGYQSIKHLPMAIMQKATDYLPVVAPFHNGMGSNQESIRTYGRRNPDSEQQFIILDNKKKFINRIGEEPGQWFSYWQMATGKKVASIPTEIKWLPNRENQQQEYTIMQNGFKHIWAGSSFLDMKGGTYNDVYEFKKNQIDELYNSLPENKKIKQ